MKTPKKRNPQDTTLRNLRAAKARIAKLEIQVANLQARVRHIEKANMVRFDD